MSTGIESYRNQPREIRVLHVDDEPDFADMAATFIQREDDRFTVETATGAREGLKKLDEKQFDCIVSDYDMPGQNGIEFLAAVRDTHPNLPFILFTGKGSEEIASEAISAGVTDYLQKESDTSQYTVLSNRIANVVDQFRSRQTLSETEQKIAQLAEHTDDILFMFNEDWSELLFTNSAYEDIWGGSVDELREDPQSFVEYIHPEDRSAAIKAMEQVAEGESIDIEYRVNRPDDEQRWIHVKTKPIFGEDGTVSRIVGYVRDITDQIERESELEQARELLHQTERIADVGGWEINTDTMEIFWTENLFDILEVDYEEAPPLDEALEVYHEDDRQIVETAVEQALDSGEPFDVEVRFRRPDGEIRWLEVSGMPTVQNGNVVTLRGAVQDITDRKSREEQLQETTTRLEALFDNSPDMIDVLDSDGTILGVNSRFCEELGYGEADLLGTPIWVIDQLVSAEDVTTLLSEFELDERRKFEGRYKRQDESTFPVEVHLLRLNLDGENRFMAISRDITERKAHEQQLVEQNEQLEQFASIVSHDLRNPLTVATGRLELAQEDCESEHHEPIRTALERIERIVEDVLWLAREGRDIGSTERVSLTKAMEAAWTMVVDDNLEPDLIVADQVKSIEADYDRLCQLLENLFRNAVEHGGENVTVTVGELDDGFYIEDDGPGIPEHKRDEVFDAGVSTSEEGTGFGLSIIRKIVEAHGWEIRVTDATDGGARFEITGVKFVAE